jgi:hypothetical protein
MTREEFFDLSIVTVVPGEAPPGDADVVRMLEPPRPEIARRVAEGWFYKPCYVTYVLRVPESLDRYIEDAFHSGTRNKPRKLLRQVPARYVLTVDEQGRGLSPFRDLYRRTIVSRPRGRDRVGEHEDGFGSGWVGFISTRARPWSPASSCTSCAITSPWPTAPSTRSTAASTSSTT